MTPNRIASDFLIDINKTDFEFFNVHRSYNASGDIRLKDQYMYEIQLSGRENSLHKMCNGASVCQVKINDQFTKAVGSSTKAKYYIDGKYMIY